MPLAVGTKAPDFTLSTKTADGPKQITLSENFRQINTLLLFFPMAFTGTCTTEMCEVSQGLNAYTDLNAAVYGISGDNPFAQEAWAQKEKIAVPLLLNLEPAAFEQTISILEPTRVRERLHRLRLSLRRAGARQDAPTLRDRIDATFVALARA